MALQEKYIFISYSHLDEEPVREMIRNLTEQGFSVWYDKRIDAGRKWNDVIANHIMDCAAFIAVVSHNYKNSENCGVELDFAIENKKRRFLVYLDRTKLSPGQRMYCTSTQNLVKYEFRSDAEFYTKLFSTPMLQVCRNGVRTAPAPTYVNEPQAKPAIRRQSVVPVRKQNSLRGYLAVMACASLVSLLLRFLFPASASGAVSWISTLAATIGLFSTMSPQLRRFGASFSINTILTAVNLSLAFEQLYPVNGVNGFLLDILLAVEAGLTVHYILLMVYSILKRYTIIISSDSPAQGILVLGLMLLVPSVLLAHAFGFFVAAVLVVLSLVLWLESFLGMNYSREIEDYATLCFLPATVVTVITGVLCIVQYLFPGLGG